MKLKVGDVFRFSRVDEAWTFDYVILSIDESKLLYDIEVIAAPPPPTTHYWIIGEKTSVKFNSQIIVNSTLINDQAHIVRALEQLQQILESMTREKC